MANKTAIVTAASQSIGAACTGLLSKIHNFLSTEIEWIPLNIINLTEQGKQNIIKFLEELDEEDDVQNIFTNALLEN